MKHVNKRIIHPNGVTHGLVTLVPETNEERTALANLAAIKANNAQIALVENYTNTIQWPGYAQGDGRIVDTDFLVKLTKVVQ